MSLCKNTIFDLDYVQRKTDLYLIPVFFKLYRKYMQMLLEVSKPIHNERVRLRYSKVCGSRSVTITISTTHTKQRNKKNTRQAGPTNPPNAPCEW